MDKKMLRQMIGVPLVIGLTSGVAMAGSDLVPKDGSSGVPSYMETTISNDGADGEDFTHPVVNEDIKPNLESIKLDCALSVNYITDLSIPISPGGNTSLTEVAFNCANSTVDDVFGKIALSQIPPNTYEVSSYSDSGSILSKGSIAVGPSGSLTPSIGGNSNFVNEYGYGNSNVVVLGLQKRPEVNYNKF